MKINPILQKFESQLVSSPIKQDFHKKVSKGDLVSIVYYDLEKDKTVFIDTIKMCKAVYSKKIGNFVLFLNLKQVTLFDLKKNMIVQTL